MQRPRTSDFVFFASGAAALIYQVAWARLLARLTGSDSIGIALVLAVFMAGMGCGSWFFAERVRRVRSPRRLFAILTATMGLWAIASPALLSALQPVDELTTRAGVAALLLLIPTAIMGATFPLMGRLTIKDDARAGSDTARFYGANTLGAAAGALLGSFLVFPVLGLSRGLLAGACLDFVAAALVLRLAVPDTAVDSKSEHAARDSFKLRNAALLLTFLFGTAGLALEVLLTRLLITVTGASVFAFAIVLTVFLCGIGLGGRQAHSLLARPGGARRLVRECALWLPVVGFAGLFFLRFQLGERDLFGVLSNRMPSGTSTLLLWTSQAFLAALALFPPAWAFGLALPACTALIVEVRGTWSREKAMGRLYALNTAGATLGSLGAGFVLLPAIGPRLSLGVAFALAWLAAPISRLGNTSGQRQTNGIAFVGLTALGVALGWAALRPAAAESDVHTLLHRVGRDSTVSVLETPTDSAGTPGVRSLLINGKVVATTAPVDLRLQRLLGTIPARLQGNPRTALVIGLGTGMTAGALLDFPTLKSLLVFEISETVREGAQLFDAFNSGLLRDPRARIKIADGRHALALESQLFDIVTSDPIHPWTRGSSDLYALEHFQQMAAHLAPGGVASQWLPLYQLATRDVKTIVATWCGAFEHTSAWLSAYDLVLVGSREVLPVDERFEQPIPDDVAINLGLAGIHSRRELAALLIAGDTELRELAAGTEPMTEDHPVLEFRAPLSFLAGYAEEILAWAAAGDLALIPADSRPRAREVRALLQTFLTDLPHGLTAAAESYGQALLDLAPLD